METLMTTETAVSKANGDNRKKPILVIGGNGKTGKRVAQKLAQLEWPVRIASRSTQPKFDWNDTQNWAEALQEMDSIYITFQPDLAVAGSTEAISHLVKTASEAGVKKLVLLSGRGEEEAQACEQIVINSGLDWTIVRASWFSQNFSEGAFMDPIMAGYVELPAGEVSEPFVDAEDIADVAVAALTEDGHNGKLYEVTGPRLLTFKQAVEEIAKATGKPIEYAQVSIQAYASTLAEYGVPGDVIALITYLFTEVLDGRNESVTDGVQQALGRKPTDFSEYVKKAAAARAWG